jgi:hypothetical protein
MKKKVCPKCNERPFSVKEDNMKWKWILLKIFAFLWLLTTFPFTIAFFVYCIPRHINSPIDFLMIPIYVLIILLYDGGAAAAFFN